MSGPDLFALQFAQACAGCVLAGLALLGLLKMAARRRPALNASRAPWLLAQGLCVAVLALAMLPQRQQFSVLPAVEVAPMAAVAVVDVAAPPAAFGDAAFIDGADWPALAARAWCALYVVGLMLAASRLVRGERAMRRLLLAARREDDAQFDGVAVYRTELALSPMLLGFFKPVLLWPLHVDAFDPAQRAMILAHERTHLLRRDPLWRLAAALARTLLWFNPAMRHLQEGLIWAQEAGCDRAVLAGKTPFERRVYAGALVEQLRCQQQSSGGATAFNGGGVGSLLERMRLIRDGERAGAGRLVHAALLLVGGGTVVAVLALQPAYAWRLASPHIDRSPPATLPAPAPVVWQAPLANARLTSRFGIVSPLRPGGHHGVDFAARRGTPVLAAADGVVDTSGDLDAGGAKYGKTVSIRHADGRLTLYAHLDARRVAAGEVVHAGQTIGLSGATGKVSGPHLHFEVRENGRPVDPEKVLGVVGVFAGATSAGTRQR